MIGLFLDPEQELMFQSRIDVIGLLVDPDPRLLGWNQDLDCLARIRNGTGESDRCDRTLLGSGTETYVSESDRCDRTLSGSRTSTAWLESAWLESAWLESSPEPEQKDRIRKCVGTSWKWFP